MQLVSLSVACEKYLQTSTVNLRLYFSFSHEFADLSVEVILTIKYRQGV